MTLSSFYYSFVPLLLAFLLVKFVQNSHKPKLDAIPAVGRTGYFGSWVDAFKTLKYGREMLLEGYYKYDDGGIFRLPTLDGWDVVVTGPKLIDELRHAPDDTLSFHEAVFERIQVNFTLGNEIHDDPYHVEIIRSNLTRQLGNLFEDIRDEIQSAFQTYIPVNGNEWTSLHLYKTVLDIVARTSNRIFVGPQLCRDPEWISLNIKYTIDVVVASAMLNRFPKFLQPAVGYLFTNVRKSHRQAMKLLRPTYDDRVAMLQASGGNSDNLPNDLLTWLMIEEGRACTLRSMAQRLLTVGFAAIHTSSMSFTQAIYDLAMHSEVVSSLREEVESVVAGQGWSKAAMGSMRQVDSFLKESQRVHGLGARTMERKALKTFTFSNGTVIPEGTFVSAASWPMHNDPRYYPDPNHFDAFRFSSQRLDNGEGTKHQMVATSTQYVAFGHGRHACPGRFFAVNELKAMLAHVLLEYDVSLAEECKCTRPPDQWVGTTCMPNSKAMVRFRKRQT